MADKEKKKKKKVKEEAPAEAAPAAPEPAPAPVEEAPAAVKRPSSKGSKKAVKRSGSNVFSMFTQGQIAEFKEGFSVMDFDKDGILGKNDLRQTFDKIGKIANDKELDDMLAEAPGPINFTQLLTLFATRMQQSGGSDEDEVIIAAFKTFDKDGVIDGNNLRHALMTWGDKFSKKEVDEAFDNMVIDKKGMIDTESLISMLIGGGDDDEE